MRPPSFIAGLCVSIALAYGQSDSDLIRKYLDDVKLNPRDSLAHYLLGATYYRQNNYQSAANEFREALNGNLQPKWLEVWSHIGLATDFERTQQHDRAINEYRLAARTHDDTGGAQRVVARHLSQVLAQETKLDGIPTTVPAAFRQYFTPLGPGAIEKPDPGYSDEARAAGLEGTVFVSVTIAADGTPRDLRLKSSLGLGLDEKALETAAQWRFMAPGTPDALAVVPVNFLLPEKLSRWHLVGASFQPHDGVLRPVFLTEPYPLGPGISTKAMDEGQVIAAIHRSATVTLQFDVDEHGAPEDFQVLAASEALWGDEAIAVVSKWRFNPGLKDGEPVSVPCTLDLIWGQKIWTPELLAHMREVMGTPINTAVHPGVSASDLPGPRPNIKSIEVIEDTTPHNPYSVIFSLIISEDGVPENIDVIRSLGPEFDAAAIYAVRRLQFKPTLLNGQPVPLPALIEVDF